MFHQRRAQLYQIVPQLDEPVGVRSGCTVDLAGNTANILLQFAAGVGKVDMHLPFVFNTARALDVPLRFKRLSSGVMVAESRLSRPANCLTVRSSLSHNTSMVRYCG